MNNRTCPALNLDAFRDDAKQFHRIEPNPDIAGPGVIALDPDSMITLSVCSN